MPPRLRVRGHAHGEAHLCFVYRGALEERQPTGSTVMRDGMLRLSPAGDEHDLRFSNAGAGCLLILLRAELDWDAPLPGIRRYLSGEPFAFFVKDLRARLGSGSPVLVELSVLELLARLALCGDARKVAHKPPAWLARVRAAIADCPTAPPSTRMLAAEAQLHPVYVARAFRRWFGCSLAGYARRVRLEYARRHVIESRLPLARIAVEAGFSDQSHLQREFRCKLGHTPGALRARQVSRIQDITNPPD